MRRTKYPVVRRGDYLDLSPAGHDIWMAENNPDGWDEPTWRAFEVRCAVQPEFKWRANAARIAGEPRPHPTEDGWTMPPRSVLESLASTMKMPSVRRDDRRRRRRPTNQGDRR